MYIVHSVFFIICTYLFIELFYQQFRTFTSPPVYNIAEFCTNMEKYSLETLHVHLNGGPYNKHIFTSK